MFQKGLILLKESDIDNNEITSLFAIKKRNWQPAKKKKITKKKYLDDKRAYS